MEKESECFGINTLEDEVSLNSTFDFKGIVIRRIATEYGRVIAHIRYPKNGNELGNKILIWENETEDSVRLKLWKDECFTENHPNLIAKIVPSNFGWAYALCVAESHSRKSEESN